MSEKTKHSHSHGPGCGHVAIEHDGHVDYVHDGHLCHQEGNRVEDHVVAVTNSNPEGCHEFEGKLSHSADHHHGPGCGHEAIPHGDHIDYLVDGRLHHAHGDHCDDHGPVRVATPQSTHV
jgi:hypothetical protein